MMASEEVKETVYQLNNQTYYYLDDVIYSLLHENHKGNLNLKIDDKAFPVFATGSALNWYSVLAAKGCFYTYEPKNFVTEYLVDLDKGLWRGRQWLLRKGKIVLQPNKEFQILTKPKSVEQRMFYVYQDPLRVPYKTRDQARDVAYNMLHNGMCVEPAIICEFVKRKGSDVVLYQWSLKKNGRMGALKKMPEDIEKEKRKEITHECK